MKMETWLNRVLPLSVGDSRQLMLLWPLDWLMHVFVGEAKLKWEL